MIRRMDYVEISLLGRFEVRVDDRLVPAGAWAHGRARDPATLLRVTVAV